jgi:hypothetical protein
MSILTTIFAWLLTIGAVEPMNDTNEGRELYYIYVMDDEYNIRAYEYAYKEEIYNYIVTGKFEYNEDLTEEDFTWVENFEQIKSISHD